MAPRSITLRLSQELAHRPENWPDQPSELAVEEPVTARRRRQDDDERRKTPMDVENRLSTIEQQLAILVDALHGSTARKSGRQLRAQTRALLPDVPQELQSALLRAPEPRIQHKKRDMQPRKRYSLRPVTTAAMIHSIQELTPGAASIVAFLASHPRVTVPELEASLALKRKTVQNLLSILQSKGLLEIEDAH